MCAAELQLVFDHVKVCQSCRQMLGEAQQTQATFKALRTALKAEARDPLTHLRYEQLVAYVDQTADEVEREIVESHMEICSSCAADAQDLQAFQEEIRPAETTATSRTPSAFWEKFKAFWQKPRYRIPLQLAGATLAIILLVWLAILPLRRRVADLQAKLDAAQQKNDELQQQAATVDELRAQLAELQQAQSDLPASTAQELYDGGRIVVWDKQGNLSGIEGLAPPIQQAVRAALINDRGDLSPELRGLIGKAGTLMGGSGEGISFALLSPVGTLIETDRPTFRWQALKGAAGYVVNVLDSNFNNVATSDKRSATEWTAIRPLKRNEIYSWQVTAIKDSKEITSPVPPAPEARFKVLDETRAEELNRAKKSYTNSHLILGALYKQAGLLDSAEREFKQLLAANPNSAVARRLLHSVRSLRQR